MKQSRRTREQPSLSKILFVSVILHLIFISFAAVPIRIKTRDFRSYTVKLVGPIETLNKKVVADSASKITPAPKKTAKTAVKAPKAAAVKPAPKSDITLEEVEKVSKEIERLRAISDLAKRLEQEKKKKKKQELREIRIAAKAALEKPVEVAGAQTEETGEDADTVSYYDIITQAIEQKWVYSGRDTLGLEAIILITINRDGKIIIKGIKKPSGNVLYDRSAIKALTDASPLPPPPEGVDPEIEILF